MNERTKNVAWITVIVGTVAVALFGWWRQKRSSIGSYADVKDIEPGLLKSPGDSYPSKPVSKSSRKTRPAPKLAQGCEPVEIVQDAKSNTQILACRGKPLGRIQSAKDAYEFTRGQAQLLQEELVVLSMNSRNNILATSMVHRGSATGTHVSPVDVFRVPIVHGASRMLLVHNHPSGDPAPSQSDVTLTKKIRDLGDELGIALLDHVVVGSDGYASFRDLGMLE